MKSDKDYVVPDELYTNATLKRNEILLFGAAVHKAKMFFNNKFLALRSEKKKLREELLKTQDRIIQINKLLASGSYAFLSMTLKMNHIDSLSGGRVPLFEKFFRDQMALNVLNSSVFVLIDVEQGSCSTFIISNVHVYHSDVHM